MKLARFLPENRPVLDLLILNPFIPGMPMKRLKSGSEPGSERGPELGPERGPGRRIRLQEEESLVYLLPTLPGVYPPCTPPYYTPRVHSCTWSGMPSVLHVRGCSGRDLLGSDALLSLGEVS